MAFERCMKFLLFTFNFLFSLTGLVIVIAGGIFQYLEKNYTEFIKDGVLSLPMVLIVIGSIIFVISTLGCVGACKESRWMLGTFAFFLVLIVLAEIGFGIAGYILRAEISDAVDKKAKEDFANYNSSENMRKTIDLLQIELQCCGSDGYEDWAKNKMQIPTSCCAELLLIEENKTSPCTEFSPTLRRTGCKPIIVNRLKDAALIIGSIGIGIAGLQIVGIFYACLFTRSLNRDYDAV